MGYLSHELLNPERKRELIELALGYGGADPAEIDQNSPAWRAMDEGIGNPGGRYHSRKSPANSHLLTSRVP